MPSFPIRIRGKYAVWSTVIDMPITVFVDSLDRLREIAPNTMEKQSAKTLENVAVSGSPWANESGEGVVTFNNAGEGNADNPGRRLSIDALLEAYADTPDGWRRAAANSGAVDQAFGLFTSRAAELGGTVSFTE
jgi:hypothetical protein